MLIFIYSKKYGYQFTCLHMNIQLFQNHLEKRLAFLHWIIFVKYHLFMNVRIYFCGFLVCSIDPYICLSLHSHHTVLFP